MLDNIDIQDIKDIALKAGVSILEIYNDKFEVEYKEDDSPLTCADKKANDIICNSLKKLYPNIPIISEEDEQVDYEIRKNWEYYWCIDPIDGTREFINKNGEFTVNIALLHNNIPVLGVVYSPIFKDMYSAKKNEGAFKFDKKLPLKVNNKQKEFLKVATSRSQLSPETIDYINNLDTKKIEHIKLGSSLKICMVAEGEVDIYPRLAPTMEWDTAASDIIIRESGKKILQYNSNELVVYNKITLLNPWFIVK